MVTASPCNPTGSVYALAEPRAIAEWARKHDVWIISDEIYHGIAFGGVEPTSAIACSSDAIVVNSFSKYFSMMGWRLGWLVVPEDLVTSVERLVQNLFISAPTPSQQAALAGVGCRDATSVPRPRTGAWPPAVTRPSQLRPPPRGIARHLVPCCRPVGVVAARTAVRSPAVSTSALTVAAGSAPL